MRLRIHQALFAGFVLVIAAAVVSVVALVGSGLRGELKALYRAELARELRLAEMALQTFPDAGPDELAGEITRRIGYRVTLISSEGRVLGDSDIPEARLGRMESYAERPEVSGALSGGGTVFSERLSATVGRPLLFAARPVDLDGDTVVLRIAASLDEIDAAMRGVRLAVVGAGALTLLAALLISYGASRALASPLKQLVQRTREMADGDFGGRAPRVGMIVELQELAASYNRLAEELELQLASLGRDRDEMQALIDSMAEGVIALSDDARVVRVNRAAAELLDLPRPLRFAPIGSVVRHPRLRELLEGSVVRPFRAREVALEDRHLIFSARLLDRGGSVVTFLEVTELRRLEQVRRDFVANASHELKTPLTAMRGFAETLLEDDPPEPYRSEFLQSIRSNTLRLQRLVDDLLDLSRLESGGWVAKEHEVELGSAARAAWSEFEARARERDVEFSVTGDARVVADEQGLDQVFRNLFDNALRYTEDAGAVSVRVRKGDRVARVEVSDTGAGIPSSALARIFERFYRVDAHRAREEGGTGLGLAIVRHLVQAMGGEVAARSRLGEGTTVVFTLPLARAGDDEPEGDEEA